MTIKECSEGPPVENGLYLVIGNNCVALVEEHTAFAAQAKTSAHTGHLSECQVVVLNEKTQFIDMRIPSKSLNKG